MPVGTKGICECCGSTDDVSVYKSAVAAFELYLCSFCWKKGHEPKWILDITAEEAGGAEFCQPYIRDMIRNGKFCVPVESEGE